MHQGKPKESEQMTRQSMGRLPTNEGNPTKFNTSGRPQG